MHRYSIALQTQVQIDELFISQHIFTLQFFGPFQGLSKELCEEQLKLEKLGKQKQQLHGEFCHLEWLKETQTSDIEDMKDSLQKLTERLSQLAENKDAVAQKLSQKQTRLGLLLENMDRVEDRELWEELITEVELSIEDLEKELETTKTELGRCQAEKDKLAVKLSPKLKELETVEKNFETKKEDVSRVSTALDVERLLFDLHLRRLNLSAERQLQEVKVSFASGAVLNCLGLLISTLSNCRTPDCIACPHDVNSQFLKFRIKI